IIKGKLVASILYRVSRIALRKPEFRNGDAIYRAQNRTGISLVYWLLVLNTVFSYHYTTKKLKRKAKNHNSKLKTFSLNTKF
ncbi:unnamed protein product, partial [marine sediment metagenome]